MKKLKIVCITATRADYPRIKSLLHEIKKDSYFSLKVIVTGQHLSPLFGNTYKEIVKDKFQIYKKIPILNSKKNNLSEMTKSVGRLIIKLPDILNKLQPDLVLITVDRVETLGAALVSSYMNFPTIHVQGGEVSGTIDEHIRHAVTKLSHIHFVANEDAKKRLIRLGENKKYVFNTGCPYVDIIKNLKIKKKSYLEKKYQINLKKKLIIFIQHPVTTEYEKTRQQINLTLKAIKRFENIEIVAFYPNSDAGGLKIINKIKKIKNVKFIKNMISDDFLSLMKHSSCIVGNSSSAIREAPSFATPSVNIGTRQRNRVSAKNVINVGFSQKKIESAISKCLYNKKFLKSLKTIKNPYGDGVASKKIIKILKKNIDFKKIVKEKVITY